MAQLPIPSSLTFCRVQKCLADPDDESKTNCPLVSDWLGSTERDARSHCPAFRHRWTNSSANNSYHSHDLGRQYLRSRMWRFVGKGTCETPVSGWHRTGDC